VEFLTGQPVAVTACVATEYGEALLPASDSLTVRTGRMDREEMEALFRAERFDCVLDATHPYAAAVTENIAAACLASGLEYLRVLRPETAMEGDAVFFPDVASAVQFLRGTEGNILLTTGSRQISEYAKLEDFPGRVYARVLPLEESLRACREAGLRTDHILAMQGPFSAELNAAMLRAVSARYMVTKEAGAAGGFSEKLCAARETGTTLLVIGRPAQREGLSPDEAIDTLCRRFGLVRSPRVALVGMGPGTPELMTQEARRAVREADCLIGAARMLDMVSTPGQRTYCEISPRRIADFIAENVRFQRFAVLLSGDTGFFSGARGLLPLLGDCHVRVLPGLSSLSCLCARLGTSCEDVASVSVHGREHDIVPDVLRNRRVFVLTGGGDEGQSVAGLCRRLTQAGLGEARVSVGERLGYPDERVTRGKAEELAEGRYDVLSVMLIEHERAFVVTQGLPDTAFLRGNRSDGAVVPMTKSELRAVCLSKLRLTEDAVCWDVGSGTGSVAVEMARTARRGRVFAVERDAGAAALITENRERFFVPNLSVVTGTAPEACRELPAPGHVFIGGADGSIRDVIRIAMEKNPDVRIAATAVSLETVAELTACMRDFAFEETECVLLNVARGKKAGAHSLMTAGNPVWIFSFQAGGVQL